jgi:crotonobetainyl-CoA:carnitine CoA-transferase CaiB-like acyl-CoA transferase
MNPATTTGPLPLSDVTVVDLTQVLAGPFATMTLGDLGAEVVKIEAVGRGDRSRRLEPIPEYFDTINRNKRSIAVDLRTEAGQGVVHDLVAEADVLVESMKPGRPEKFNLSYEDLTGINPELVYCSITGFGAGSPYENLPAWDMLVQAMSGIMSLNAPEEGPPLWSALATGDLAGGMYAAQSVLAALYARSEGHIEGEWIEVPMLDAAVSWIAPRAGYTFGFDEPFPRGGTHHPSIAPFGAFECADGYMVVAAGTDSLFADLCAALDRPDLLADERFESFEGRIQHRDVLADILTEEFADGTRAEWLDTLHGHDVPAGRINDTETVWEDDHVQQRGLRREMPREDRQDAEVIDHPVHFRHLVASLRTAPETLGESTDDVLAECGYSAEEREKLREQGVVE